MKEERGKEERGKEERGKEKRGKEERGKEERGKVRESTGRAREKDNGEHTHTFTHSPSAPRSSRVESLNNTPTLVSHSW